MWHCGVHCEPWRRPVKRELPVGDWDMNSDDETGTKKPLLHEIGQDLSMISVDELGQRIELLRAEIVRLEEEAAEKSKSRTAADALFKSG